LGNRKSVLFAWRQHCTWTTGIPFSRSLQTIGAIAKNDDAILVVQCTPSQQSFVHTGCTDAISNNSPALKVLYLMVMPNRRTCKALELVLNNQRLQCPCELPKSMMTFSRILEIKLQFIFLGKKYSSLRRKLRGRTKVTLLLIVITKLCIETYLSAQSNSIYANVNQVQYVCHIRHPCG
jgi:hypothetical protein